jgi:Family of unknown function (DUF6807)
MKLLLSSQRARFIHESVVAGECVLDDAFKPYIHPLRTPAGHIVTKAMPVDHRHHKGLMFGLRCPDLNFWEENPGCPDCGVQKVVESQVENGVLVLDLLWSHENGEMKTYREERRISCEVAEDGSFLWTWRSKRKALRDHRLMKSQWSYALPDGRKINYHGLGIRFPWAWAWPEAKVCGVKIDGKTVKAEEACGQHGPAVTWWGWLDGAWTPPVASVTMRQNHGFDWFALQGDFAYLSAGPSNREEVDVKFGQTFEETYQVEIRDLK